MYERSGVQFLTEIKQEVHGPFKIHYMNKLLKQISGRYIQLVYFNLIFEGEVIKAFV